MSYLPFPIRRGWVPWLILATSLTLTLIATAFPDWLPRRHLATVTLVGGLLASLLLFWAARMQAQARQEVERGAAILGQTRSDLGLSRKQLRMAMEAASIGNWDWNILTGKLWWSRNLEAIFGLGEGAFAGSLDAFIELIHPDDRALVRQYIDAALAGGGEYNVDFRRESPDGSLRWINCRGQVIRDSACQPVRMIGLGMDVTQRKTTEETLRQAKEIAEAANRDKDEFLATVSHELRTPLTAIVGWAKLLSDPTCEPAMLREGIDAIERNAAAQAQLIEDILDISRIITGKLRINVRLVSLPAVIDAAIQTVKPAADARGIALHCSIDPQIDPLRGDPDRLQQVVWNLLSNAIKFSPRDAAVDIRLEQAGPHACLTVRDRGIGIRADFLPYVFDRFRQADTGSARRHGGLGLGLAIVRHLVELHGGTIRVHSDGYGKGTAFTVQLPLVTALHRPDPAPVPPSGDPAKPAPETNLPQGQLQGLSILVVDDEPDSRRVLATILQRGGATVTLAASAAQALAFLKEGNAPGVIVSDIGMPDQDGYALIRQVRQLEQSRGTQTPAIALTAYTRPEERAKALAAGFQLHIPKPIEPAELIAAVASLTKLVSA